MNAETWARRSLWVDAKLNALLVLLDQYKQAPIDLDKLIGDVLAGEPAWDVPDQKSALRTLISTQLQKDHMVAARLTDDNFPFEVDLRNAGPVTDQERAEHAYVTAIARRLSAAQIANSINALIAALAA